MLETNQDIPEFLQHLIPEGEDRETLKFESEVEVPEGFVDGGEGGDAGGWGAGGAETAGGGGDTASGAAWGGSGDNAANAGAAWGSGAEASGGGSGWNSGGNAVQSSW